MDGMIAMVYKTSDSGLHGTAISPYAKTPKDIEKLKKKATKQYSDGIKKGELTQEELDERIQQIECNSKIPFIQRIKNVYHTGDCENLLPNGWRIPTTTDAEDFAIFYCGGLGKDYKFSTNRYKELSSDKFIQQNLLWLSLYGFICKDPTTSSVRFLQNQFIKLKGKSYFAIKDKYITNKQTGILKMKIKSK